MKIAIINEERQPESVAPKMRVYETEADLNAALPDLKDGAIVATKEDETSEITESRDKTYVFRVADSPSDAYFCADKPQGYAHILFIADQNTQMINIIWNASNAGLNYIGAETGDAITAGLDDNVYGGASCHVKVNKRGIYFITTKDCILEHIEVRI